MRVDVLIPCHNAAAFVLEAIDSALADGLDDGFTDGSPDAPSDPAPQIAVMVVDDGSTDNSAALVGRRAESDPRVRLIRQHQQGAAAARNRALQATTGELVAFLDADDRFAPGSVRWRAAHLAEHPRLDAVYGQVRTEVYAGVDRSTLGAVHAEAEPVLARLFGTLMFRRASFERVGSFDAALGAGELFEWLGRAGHAGLHIEPVARPALLRRVHGANSVLTIPDLADRYLRALHAKLRAERGPR